MTAPRRIGIVTSARSDFGLMQGLICAVDSDPALTLTLFVTGMHHSKKHGHTRDEICTQGFEHAIVDVPSFRDDDKAGGIAYIMSAAIGGFAQAFETHDIDILVILGDRYDAFPAALAALPFNIPIAHIAGGERTEGVIDEAIRHSLTKFAHVHFPSTQDYGRRIRQLGEEAWRIVVSGQPGLDALNTFVPLDRQAFAEKHELQESKPITIITLHPETLDQSATEVTLNALLQAIEDVDTQLIITAPNSDTGNDLIHDAWHTLVEKNAACVYIESLGRNGYLHALANVDCMVGNSSSGITEAANFKLPVVNIGPRQLGRSAGRNVIHCGTAKADILAAWRHALDPAFRDSLHDLINEYGDGHAVTRIIDTLKTTKLDKRLLEKHFIDWPEPETHAP
tara:strand:+ start:1167 stop:2354 length:1188 start_codon:yes stop_codon:yes gene_type:complete